MSPQGTWEQARQLALDLKSNDRRTMLLLRTLPLASEVTLERISGVSHGASVYSCLVRLRDAGLVSSIRPAHPDTPGPRLHFLTDLGLATMAVDQDVDVREFARAGGARRTDILALLPQLDQLTAIYELVGQLAMAGPDDPQLTAYTRPWRWRSMVPGYKRPLNLVLPAFATFDWVAQTGSLLLLPDVTGTPIRRYRQALDRLLVKRAYDKHDLPLLVIATGAESRVARWKELLHEVEQARREAPIPAAVAIWTELPARLARQISSGHVPAVRAPQRKTIPPLKSVRWADKVPNLVGDLEGVEAGTVEGAAHRGALSLKLTRPDRGILQLLGRHPFLTPDEIGVLFGWTAKRTHDRCRHLIGQGLLRTLDEQETRGHPDAAGRLELTKEGLRLVAAQRRSGVSAATNQSTIIGGGPASPSLWRTDLVDHLDHTIGANRVFVGLCLAAGRQSANGSADALEEWQSPAEACRSGFYPDGYGMYRRNGKLHGFFLEYDRGYEKARQYLRKFGAHYDIRDTGRLELDYAGVPTILVVTTGNAAENRIARAAQAASVGRTCQLRILLTTEWRVKRDPQGYLGRVWRTPGGGFDQRGLWLAVPASQSAVTLGPNAGHHDALAS